MCTYVHQILSQALVIFFWMGDLLGWSFGLFLLCTFVHQILSQALIIFLWMGDLLGGPCLFFMCTLFFNYNKNHLLLDCQIFPIGITHGRLANAFVWNYYCVHMA